MAAKHESLERYLFMQKLIKAKLYEDLEDVVDKMVKELEPETDEFKKKGNDNAQ